MDGTISSLQSPAASATVTDGRAAHPKRWVIAYTQMNRERAVRDRLACLGFEAYVPVQSVMRQWSDRRKRVERVLIPTVVFVNTVEARQRELVSLSFVNRLMRAPGGSAPAVIGDDEMRRFMFLVENATEELTIEAPHLRQGTPVMVTAGELKGLSGRVVFDPEGRSRIIVAIKDLCNASVSIPAAYVEPLEAEALQG